MNIDINLVSSLKVGEYLQVSETEVLACVSGKCSDCYFKNTNCDNVDCKINGDYHLTYTILKLKQ